MIINCLACGKAVSTKRDICPYCKVDISEFVGELGGAYGRDTIKERLKGSILSLVIR